MKHNTYKYFPPNCNLKGECGIFAAGLGAAALYSTIFLDHFFNAKADLYQWVANSKVLRQGAVMEPFSSLSYGVFNGFLILAVCMTQFVLWHYMSHYAGSKSIYLMKRLPDRGLLHRECWTLPILGAVLSGLAALLMQGIYYFLYLKLTPAGCLPTV